MRPSSLKPRRQRSLVTAAALAAVLAGPPPLLARLIICEIDYHPHGSTEDDEALEFVEVFNDEPLPFDISGYQLQGGITYTFPPGTIVEARSVVVVALDPVRLAAARGIAAPLGPFEGRLGNDGDEVLIADRGGSTVSRVPYNDRGGWPAAADGAGATLVLKNPLLDPSEGESWGWSALRGGTPGAVSFEAAPSEALINEVRRDGAGGGWVELFNPGQTPVALEGYRILGDEDGQASRELPAGSSIGARGFFVVSEAELGFPLQSADQRLFLVAADGRRVVDARRVGERSGETSDGRHPDGSTRWYRLPLPTRGAPNELPPPPPVVISEIHYHPYSENEAEEFVEIANIGSQPVDLEGFAFTSGVDFVFPPGAVIAPGAHLVVAADPARVGALHGLDGVHGPWLGVLSNSGEMLRLRDRLGNPVDEVRWHDEGSWPPLADGHGPSLELEDLRQDGSAGAAWRESDHAAGSQWTQFEYAAKQSTGDSEFHLYLLGPGEVLVDDVEVVPAEGGANHIPNGTFEGDNPLAGWVIDGTHIDSRIEPGAGPDGSNALRIVASKRGDTGVNRIERQTTPNLVAGKQYTVRFKARWLAGSDLIMTRSWNHGIAGVSRLPVPPLGGTPGRGNSRFQQDSGPVIGSVEQNPVLPAPAEPVIVRAHVADPDGVASVTVRARLDGEAGFTAAEMRDDGIEPDLLQGDGVFAGRIELAGARGGAAEFYIEARDAGGLTRLSPPEAPGVTYIYQYDDEIAASAVPACRLVMLRRDHQALVARSAFSNHHLPVALVFRDERIFNLARLRYRGSFYLRRPQITGPQKGFRVRVSREDAFMGSTRITLDEQAVDPTLQIDRLVRHLHQQAGGIPYGERRHVHLIFRGASFGAYEQVLTVDSLYLKRSFGDDDDRGDLYKIDAHYEIDDRGEFPFPTFTSWKHTDDKEALRFTYKKRSRTKEDDFSGLMTLLDLMDTNRTANEAFDQRAPGLLDLDNFVKGIAVYRAAEDWDAIGGWTGKNVYLYHHPDGRWRFIPWDHDVAFGAAALQADQNARAYLYTPYFPEIRRLLQRPALERKYLRELLRLMKEDYDRPVVDPVLDRTYDLLRPTTGVSSPAGIKTFLGTRRSYILSQISNPPAFAIETNGGSPFSTTEANAILSGKAPYEVDLILANGAPAAARWQDKTTWELDVRLAPGENLVVLDALDAEAKPAGTASIRITREGVDSSFTRADANNDARVDLSDAVTGLHYLFGGGALSCLDAADTDDSGNLNITDPIYLLRFLFQGGPQPPAPFPEPGTDGTQDALGCD